MVAILEVNMAKLHMTELLNSIAKGKFFDLSKKYPKKMIDRKMDKALLKGYINLDGLTPQGLKQLVNMRG